MRTGTIYFILLIIVLIVAGVVIFNKSSPSSTLNTQQYQSPTSSESQEQEYGQSGILSPAATSATSSKITNLLKAKTVTVNYSGSAFSPNSITINKGDTVKFVNQSNSDMWVASDPHPTHTDYPGFDEKKTVAKGGSYSFTFQRVGSWGYHNHPNPNIRGTIIVK